MLTDHSPYAKEYFCSLRPKQIVDVHIDTFPIFERIQTYSGQFAGERRLGFSSTIDLGKTHWYESVVATLRDKGGRRRLCATVAPSPGEEFRLPRK